MAVGECFKTVCECFKAVGELTTREYSVSACCAIWQTLPVVVGLLFAEQ